MSVMPASLLPEGILFAGALAAAAFTLFKDSRGTRPVSIAAALLAATALLLQASAVASLFSGTVAIGPYQNAFRFIVTFSLFIVLLSFGRDDEGISPELYPLLMLSALGASMMTVSADLILLFISVELTALPAYVAAATARRDADLSLEAAVKYFVTGIAASATLLYGLALLAGAGGTTRYLVSGGALPVNITHQPAGLFALALVFVGLALKAAIAPFHFWSPDTYGGAPYPVAAFLSGAPKLATVAAAIFLLTGPFADAYYHWAPLLWLLSVASMFWGNLAALAQRNGKRMLAYSSVAHIGYMTAALAAAGREAVGPIAYYGLVYAIMTIGAFAALRATLPEGKAGLEGLKGLAARRPWLAMGLAGFALSLTGIPPFAGFLVKLNLMLLVVRHGQPGLAVVMALNAAISAAYYLRLIRLAYVEEGEESVETATAPVGIAVSFVLLLALGVLPGLLTALLPGFALR